MAPNTPEEAPGDEPKADVRISPFPNAQCFESSNLAGGRMYSKKEAETRIISSAKPWRAREGSDRAF
eukprot:3463989-Alexandrium_andersonii.AAC.1